MIGSLEKGGWSYDLINPQITDLDLENLQINKHSRDNLFESIYNEFQ